MTYPYKNCLITSLIKRFLESETMMFPCAVFILSDSRAGPLVLPGKLTPSPSPLRYLAWVEYCPAFMTQGSMLCYQSGASSQWWLSEWWPNLLHPIWSRSPITLNHIFLPLLFFCTALIWCLFLLFNYFSAGGYMCVCIYISPISGMNAGIFYVFLMWWPH